MDVDSPSPSPPPPPPPPPRTPSPAPPSPPAELPPEFNRPREPYPGFAVPLLEEPLPATLERDRRPYGERLNPFPGPTGRGVPPLEADADTPLEAWPLPSTARPPHPDGAAPWVEHDVLLSTYRLSAEQRPGRWHVVIGGFDRRYRFGQRYRAQRLGASQSPAQLGKHQPFRMHGPSARLAVQCLPPPAMPNAAAHQEWLARYCAMPCWGGRKPARLPMIAAASTDAELWAIAIATANPTFWNTPVYGQMMWPANEREQVFLSLHAPPPATPHAFYAIAQLFRRPDHAREAAIHVARPTADDLARKIYRAGRADQGGTGPWKTLARLHPSWTGGSDHTPSMAIISSHLQLMHDHLHAHLPAALSSGSGIKTEATDGDDTESEWSGIDDDDDELRANRADVATTTDPRVAREPAVHTSS
ncbi:MAG: hypothetical protein M1826_004599 [Phylliscum demangeonii]|nr:MAG: hypothetical protein M1826_004599 [Phylliscum demangeonii]